MPTDSLIFKSLPSYIGIPSTFLLYALLSRGFQQKFAITSFYFRIIDLFIAIGREWELPTCLK